jgi:O-antigen/teichoic acid export membrane protein
MPASPDDGALRTPTVSMRTGALWSYAAFAALAVSGAAIQLSLATFLGERGLGVFAQLYAVFVIAGQIASGGVHDSAQRHVAMARARGEDEHTPARAAVLAVLAPSLLAALILGMLADLLGRAVESPVVGTGVGWLAPGVALFAINKTLLGISIGRGELRRVALAQMLRAAALGLLVGLVVGASLPLEALGGVFSLAEAVVFARLMGWTSASPPVSDPSPWIGRHLRFGMRGLVHAALLEAHLRIDVMMLAVFVEDRVVGVYAFAALFGEGLHQVGGVLRTVVYPDVVRLLARRQWGELRRLVVRTSSISVGVTLAIGVVVVVAFPRLGALTGRPFAPEGWAILLVLVTSLVAYAAFAPFDQLLLQGGRSGAQSAWMFGAVALNVVLNAVAIPWLGGLGAACATGLAFLVSGAAMIGVGRWLLASPESEPTSTACDSW